MWLTNHVYYEQDDFDEKRKTDVDRQQLVVVIMELSTPFWFWGRACLASPNLESITAGKYEEAFYTCGFGGLWGGLVMVFGGS